MHAFGKLERGGACAKEVPLPSYMSSTSTIKNNHFMNRLHMHLTLNGKSFDALVDTGASMSFVGESVVKFCNEMHIAPDRSTSTTITLGNGSQVEAVERYDLTFESGKEKLQSRFTYLPHLPFNVVVGMDILQSLDFHFDLRKTSSLFK